jgi:hypothetical protein
MRIKTAPGWDQVYYLVECGSAGDVSTILSPQYAWLLPRIFAAEFNDGWKNWNVNITQIIATLHKRGVKALGMMHLC